MELSSRQIVALAAPVILTYLTWSTLQGQVKTLARVTPSPVASIPSRHAADVDAPRAPLRDPFSPLTAQGVLHATSEDEEAKGEPLVLNATVIVPDWRMAIINGERVYEGQRYRGLRVRKVEPQRVLLAGEEGDAVELPLQVAIVLPEKKESKEDASANELATFYDEAFPGHGAEMAAAPVPGLPPSLAAVLPGAASEASAGSSPAAPQTSALSALTSALPTHIPGADAAAALVAAQHQRVAEMMKGLQE